MTAFGNLTLPWGLVPSPLTFLAIDTTGPDPEVDRVIELAVVRLQPDSPPRHLETVVHFGSPRPHGPPGFANCVPPLRELMRGAILVGHGLGATLPLLQAEMARLGGELNPPALCTWDLAARLLPGDTPLELDELCRDLSLPAPHADAGPMEQLQSTVALLRTLASLPGGAATLRDSLHIPLRPSDWPPIIASLVAPRPRQLTLGTPAWNTRVGAAPQPPASRSPGQPG